MAESLKVEKMLEGEARDFLLKRTKQKDIKAAEEIAKELDYLPLALEQAGAYVEKTGKSLSEYLKHYRTKHTEIFESGLSKSGQGYLDTVLTTWTMSFDAAEQQCKVAGDLLSLCAYFAPDDIPLDVIVAGNKHLPEALGACVKDEKKLDEAVAALKDYSLITRNEKGLSVHRLVQEVTRDRLTEEEQKIWTTAAAEIVNEAFPFDSYDVRTWETCNRLLPHGLTAAGFGERAKVADDAVGRLLNQCGLYLKGRARYEEAKDCYNRAIKICESDLGADHPTVAICMNNLGSVLRAQGDLVGAKECCLRALKIGEATLGKDHPDVAVWVNNLGNVLQDQGDLAGAKECFERALKIGETTLGKDHPNVAIRVNNLGLVLQNQGDLAGAKEHYERALKIWEKELGENHPQVAIGVNNLGMVLKAQGDLAGAKECLERALKIDEAVHGKDHPNVARDVNNLGMVLKTQGDLAGAKECYERALKICTKFLDADHPSTKTVQGNLDLLLEERAKKMG
jgi:tetratricopeptide (TPR) repeat protein